MNFTLIINKLVNSLVELTKASLIVSDCGPVCLESGGCVSVPTVAPAVVSCPAAVVACGDFNRESVPAPASSVSSSEIVC